MSSLLVDARKVSRKVRRLNQQAVLEDFSNRIEKQIFYRAANGSTGYQFAKAPSRQEYLAKDPQLFVKIAKHFESLGFEVSYSKKEGSKTTPKYEWTYLSISWD